jgi:hypothetical protein
LFKNDSPTISCASDSYVSGGATKLGGRIKLCGATSVPSDSTKACWITCAAMAPIFQAGFVGGDGKNSRAFIVTG